MGALYLGDNEIVDVRIGDGPVSAVYLGDVLLWDGSGSARLASDVTLDDIAGTATAAVEHLLGSDVTLDDVSGTAIISPERKLVSEVTLGDVAGSGELDVGAGGITSCAKVLEAENSDVSVVVPAGVEAGDLMIFYNRSSGFPSTPAKVIPSGFTEIGSDTSTYRRITTSYKIATGSEDGATLTGQSSLDDTIMLAIFRANVPITGVSAVGYDTSGITETDPAAQALTAADATAPALAVAVYSSSGVIDPASFSTGADGAFVDATGTRVMAWEFQTSLADITVDMEDEGSANDVAAFWLELS